MVNFKKFTKQLTETLENAENLTLEQQVQELRKQVAAYKDVVDYFKLNKYVKVLQKRYKQLYEYEPIEAERQVAELIRKSLCEKEIIERAKQDLEIEYEGLKQDLEIECEGLKQKIKGLKLRESNLLLTLEEFKTHIPEKYKQYLPININTQLEIAIKELIELVNYSFENLEIDLVENTDVMKLVKKCYKKSKSTKQTETIPPLCTIAQQRIDKYYPHTTPINMVLNNLTKAKYTQLQITQYFSELIKQKLKSEEKV